MNTRFRTIALAISFALSATSYVNASAAPTFDTPLTVSTAPRVANMVLGDFDGDTHPDVAVLDDQSGVVEVHFGDGSGGFDDPPATFTVTSSNNHFNGMAAADIDGDGKSDLVFAAGNAVRIFEWNGTAFTAKTVQVNGTDVTSISLSASGINATKVAVGNLTTALVKDQDGNVTTPGSQDIVVSDDFGSVGLVWIANDGTGNFSTPTTKAAGGCDAYAKPILADVDGDGLDDVVLSHPTFDSGSGKFVGRVGVLLNNGDGTLADEDLYKNPTFSALQTRGVAVADVDDDGKPDLVTVASVQDPVQPINQTFYLNVNLNNGNGTFADGKAFQFQRNSGLNTISSRVIDTADVNGDGRADIVTLTDVGGASSFAGFTVTQWSGMGANLAVASQDDFATNFISYQCIALGYTKNDGTFVTFNEDPQVDVLVGTTSQFQSPAPPHSQFLVFPNTTTAIPTGRDIEFARTKLSVNEGDDIQVTVLRGSDGTGEVHAVFFLSGTAFEKGYEAKGQTPDYEITDPPNYTQTVVFGPDEHIKTIDISTFAGKKKESAQTVVLTLGYPWGPADIGAKSTATVTINDVQPASLGKPGALKVVPSNVIKKPFDPNLNIPADVKVAGRTGARWSFSVSQPMPDDALDTAVVKVQYSTDPPADNHWIDYLTLTHGKGSAWSNVDNHPHIANKIYFRTKASADGYPDAFSAPTQPFAVIAGVELLLDITATSDSDSTGVTTHPNEVITYHFHASNNSADAAATPAVLTVPVPAHTSFQSATNRFAQPVEIKDHGVTRAVSWTFPSLSKGSGGFDEDLFVKVDPAGAFSGDKKHPGGAGYIIAEGTNKPTVAKPSSTLSAPTQGVTVQGVEFDTEILGSYKLTASVNPMSVSPGGLITYTLTAENDSSQDLVNALVSEDIPEGTEFVQVYDFDPDGNADSSNTPNPNPDFVPSSGEAAMVYARTGVAPTKLGDFSIFVTPPLPTDPKQLSTLLKGLHGKIDPVLKPKAGTKISPAALAILTSDEVEILINGGFITPAGILWTMPNIPKMGGVRSVSLTVRVPFDAPVETPNGIPLNIVDGTYDPKTDAFIAGYDFFIPGQNIHASYGGPQPAHPVALFDNGMPVPRPHLVLSKTARGDLNLNNANFKGNGTFSSAVGHGNVECAVEGRGIDYVLTYRNDLDAQGNGADAKNVLLHDVIPVGMKLNGFFKQVDFGFPQTSGSLIFDSQKTENQRQQYFIQSYAEGDDFTNVGAPVNASGVTFKATGTTPANWSHGSVLSLATPMTAEQFTFYDKNGVIIPGVDPNDNQSNMLLVQSMDIRLGHVGALTVLPKGGSGFIEYTCSPDITSTTPYKQIETVKSRFQPHSRFVEFLPDKGTVHSFAGYRPGKGPSDPVQGFFICHPIDGFYAITDNTRTVSGLPDDVVVQVVSNVSFSTIKPDVAVNRVFPYDVAPVDLSFNQNGEVSATGTTLTFTVPTGVTFLNSASFVPRDVNGTALVTDANTHHPQVTLDPGDNRAMDGGTTTFDVQPLLIDNLHNTEMVVSATQTGNVVTLSLGTIEGRPGLENSYKVRVFFQVNGPHLDAAIVANGSAYEPADAKVKGNYTGVAARRRFSISRAGGTSTNTAENGIGVPNPQKASEPSAPHLGISRLYPGFVAKNSAFVVKISVDNTGDTPATNVHVSTKIPFGTYFGGTSNGLIVSPATVGSGGMTNSHRVAILKYRDAATASYTSPTTGNDMLNAEILDWSIDSLPAGSTFTVDLVLQCSPNFANYLVSDNSTSASASNAGAVSMGADVMTITISDSTAVALTDPDHGTQSFFDRKAFSLNPSFDPTVSAVSQHLQVTPLPQVHSLAGLDVLQLPASSVKVIPLGHDQVRIVASGGGNIISHDGGTLQSLVFPNGEKLQWDAAHIVAQGGGNIVAQGGGNLVNTNGGNIVAQGGGNIVAQGGGNFITITNIPNGIGTQTAAWLVDPANVLNIVAAGAGNIVAAGGGNLVNTNGGNLVNNHDGSISNVAIGQISNAVVRNDNGRMFVDTAGNALAAGLITSDGAGLITSDGAGLITSDGAGLMSVTAGAIGMHGAGILGHNGSAFAPQSAPARPNPLKAAATRR